MDANWIASMVANECFVRVPCGAVAPVKGDILIKRVAIDGLPATAVLVKGVYPNTGQIAIARLEKIGLRFYWADRGRIRGGIENGQWRCVYNKKMEPKPLPNAPVPHTQKVREVPPHIVSIVKDQYETLNLFYGQKYECPICMDEIFGSDLHITKCGHFFCKGCIAGLPPQWERTDGCPSCRARA